MCFVLIHRTVCVLDVPFLYLTIFTPNLKHTTAIRVTYASLGPTVLAVTVQGTAINSHVPQEYFRIFRGGQELVFIRVEQFNAVYVRVVPAIDSTGCKIELPLESVG